MAYAHTNYKGTTYYLHSTTVTLRGSGKKQTIYFFRRNEQSGGLDEVPQGFQIVESKRTGLPVLKRT